MKQKKQLAVLAILLLLAVFTWRSVYSSPQAITTETALTANFPVLAVENPQLHRWKLDAARKTDYKPNGRNIFTPAPIPPPPPPRDLHPKPPDPPVEVPPPPPVLPVKFFGYGSVAGAPRRAFFSDGDQVYIAAEGEVLMGRYRIVKIGNATLEFEEISSGQRGTAALEEPQGPQA